MAETIKTSERVISIALSTEQLQTLLADNTDLVQGLFRTLAERRQVKPDLIKAQGPADPE